MAPGMVFEGKVALITGAASGIGLATAERFASWGATVVLSDIATEQGQKASDELQERGAESLFIRADVSDQNDVASLFREIDDRYGKLDFAFNNAGIEGDLAPIVDSTMENWRRVIEINLSSAFYCMKEEIPLMRKAGGGVIVNCSSVAGLVGVDGGAAYCASKHGLIGITKAVALDHARENIRVNAICPGVVDTAMVQRFFEVHPERRNIVEESQPVGRIGKPEEIASAVTWLCLPESAFVTGVALPVDGAWTAR
jgi:NAD(P)-dependent dehydrogenase (short-subunit alcohol dehydrogenase family)